METVTKLYCGQHLLKINFVIEVFGDILTLCRAHRVDILSFSIITPNS